MNTKEGRFTQEAAQVFDGILRSGVKNLILVNTTSWAGDVSNGRVRYLKRICGILCGNCKFIAVGTLQILLHYFRSNSGQLS
ncbi:hypothetical protein SORBI_3008G121600 [Sorghum bicolor]|uniref:Uncharacterized protein n=1 Tax=Sorghum bicolor TaxID=4558 RepID=A0A1B6PDN5_SORBI|nr:hypothetical protein SORBI_3008G121600 [Sorghum bicolor]